MDDAQASGTVSIGTVYLLFLSNDDTTAPIVQTIALHAATMLADDPSDRHGVAREIKRAYAQVSFAAYAHSTRRSRDYFITWSNPFGVAITAMSRYFPGTLSIPITSS